MNIKHNLRQQKGFFLVEASIALFILSVVLVSVIPAWILLQEKMEGSHQKALGLVAAQNEIQKFNHYLEEAGEKEVEVSGYSFLIAWQIMDNGGVEEGRLNVSWHSSSKTNEKVNYHLYRVKRDTL